MAKRKPKPPTAPPIDDRLMQAPSSTLPRPDLQQVPNRTPEKTRPPFLSEVVARLEWTEASVNILTRLVLEILEDTPAATQGKRAHVFRWLRVIEHIYSARPMPPGIQRLYDQALLRDDHQTSIVLQRKREKQKEAAKAFAKKVLAQAKGSRGTDAPEASPKPVRTKHPVDRNRKADRTSDEFRKAQEIVRGGSK